MNSYIKHIVEAFDFGSVNKQKKAINAYDILFKERLNSIVNKILNSLILEEDEKKFMLSLPVACYQANDKEIRTLVKVSIEIFGDNCNLNWIDTSNITNIHNVFSFTKFNGDISKWNVSNITNMSMVFSNTEFTGDISKWNVSNVTNMREMFAHSKFNGDISKWDVSNVKNMNHMF
jgi:surface protein